ncbi:MAG: FtsW/RodA/SpoVE family cell cycle protein [Bacilli bacterium]
MNKDIKKIDKLLLFLVTVLCILGLVMIYSASSASTILRYHVSSNHFFIRQLLVLVLSYAIGIFILFFPTKRYKFLSYAYSFLVMILLIAVLVKGKIAGNAQSWFDLGPFNLQPSELAKSALIIFMAVYYNNLSKRNTKNLTLYFLPLFLAVTYTVLTLMQPDWGSGAIILAIAFLTFLSVPMIKKNILKILKILAIGVVIIVVVLLYKGGNILSSNKLSRLNFKNPCERYQEQSGYQVCNALIAISNGGLFGVGLGQSSQKYLYLPESHTDMIFPIICEELGAIVGTLIIIVYGIILFKLFKIAKASDNLRTSILAYGTFWYFALHIFINIFGLLALIPLTGVPLPFLSYGGSYTLNAVLMIFVVERVAIENQKNKLNRQLMSI